MSEQSCEGTGLWAYFTLGLDSDSRIRHPWMRHDGLSQLECELWIVDRPKGIRRWTWFSSLVGLLLWLPVPIHVCNICQSRDLFVP